MCTLDQLTSQMASNIFEDLSDEQILFLKFCSGYNLKPSLLRSEVFKDQKIYVVEGFIWKYQTVNFKNNGNFLDNELLIHLKHIQKIEKSTVPEPGIQIGNAYGGVVTLPISTSNITTYASAYSEVLTKNDIDNVIYHKQNQKIKNKSSDDIFISLKDFCQNYKSQKFTFDKILQQKKLKIVII